MQSRARVLVAALSLVAVAAGVVVPARAEPVSEPIDPSIPAPPRGVFDPMDFPQLAAPDPALVTLEVPDHTWMLFSDERVPAIRGRIAAGRSATPGDFDSL